MRKRPRPGVYVLRDNDDDSGRVVRVGRTKDMNRRQREHRRDPLLARFDFEEVYDTASYPVQRGLEQLLHDQHRPRFDIIEPISARSPRRHIYLAAARRFLQAQGHGP